MAMNVIIRLDLALSELHGQTYCMTKQPICQVSTDKKKQPMAVYVHCGAHCVNLITQKACSASVLTRDSLDWVHQLGILCGLSSKFIDIFNRIATSDRVTPTALKPLPDQMDCQT